MYFFNKKFKQNQCLFWNKKGENEKEKTLESVFVFVCLKSDMETTNFKVCFQKRNESFQALFSYEKIAEFIDFLFIFDSNFKHFFEYLSSPFFDFVMVSLIQHLRNPFPQN